MPQWSIAGNATGRCALCPPRDRTRFISLKLHQKDGELSMHAQFPHEGFCPDFVTDMLHNSALSEQMNERKNQNHKLPEWKIKCIKAEEN